MVKDVDEGHRWHATQLAAMFDLIPLQRALSELGDHKGPTKDDIGEMIDSRLVTSLAVLCFEFSAIVFEETSTFSIQAP